jgi:hypothetical protein
LKKYANFFRCDTDTCVLYLQEEIGSRGSGGRWETKPNKDALANGEFKIKNAGIKLSSKYIIERIGKTARKGRHTE